MKKTILITGATDGIGLETAKTLVEEEHKVLIHGRNAEKLAKVQTALSTLTENAHIETYLADLSRLADVEALADSVTAAHNSLDVLINNAGIYSTKSTRAENGLDVRFVVNTIAPYLLTKHLLPLLGNKGRVINVSSAAQAPVNLEAFNGKGELSQEAAYAQSKLALTMWSRSLALSLDEKGPTIIAVNPGSLLGSKMVKEAYGIEGGNIRIGADILVHAALSDEFDTVSGRYYDNDSRQFSSPHPDALDAEKSNNMISQIEAIITSDRGELN